MSAEAIEHLDRTSYFAVQYERDVIVLDVASDRYLFRRNAILDVPSGDPPSGDVSLQILDIEQPSKDGYPPKGHNRDLHSGLLQIALAFWFLLRSISVASRGFSSVVPFVSRIRKAKRLASATEADLRRLASAIELARLICPFKAKCLPASIALVKLARWYGHDASLIVGVQALPLRAHAWVQTGDALINDTLERVLQYRPILRLPLDAAGTSSSS